MRIFSFLTVALSAALAFCSATLAKAADIVERGGSWMLGMVPMLATAPVAMLDNGHPRSPIASMRAGLA